MWCMAPISWFIWSFRITLLWTMYIHIYIHLYYRYMHVEYLFLGVKCRYVTSLGLTWSPRKLQSLPQPLSSSCLDTQEPGWASRHCNSNEQKEYPHISKRIRIWIYIRRCNTCVYICMHKYTCMRIHMYTGRCRNVGALINTYI